MTKEGESVTWISMCDRLYYIMEEYAEAQHLSPETEKALKSINKTLDSIALNNMQAKPFLRYLMLLGRAVCQLLDEHK